MAGKYALYLPYKVLDSLSSGNVTDSQFREFIMGLAEYDKTGAFPASHTPGFAMMYELLKSDLDYAKTKYEDIVEKRRIAGQQGGAPEGNKNAVRNRGGGAPEGNQNAVGNSGGGAPPGNRNAKKEAPEQEPELENQTQTQPKQPKQPKQAESDNSSQLSESETENSGGEVVKQPPPKPPLSSEIKNQIKTRGFFIDDDKSLEILIAEIDPAWFEGHTFIDFIADWVRKAYGEKPEEEQRLLFRKLLFDAPNLREQYPGWREHHETVDKEREKKRAIEKARAAVPKDCPVCGATLNYERRCPCGHGVYVFQDNEQEYKFYDTTKDDGNNLAAEFQERLRLRQGSKLDEVEVAS